MGENPGRALPRDFRHSLPPGLGRFGEGGGGPRVAKRLARPAGLGYRGYGDRGRVRSGIWGPSISADALAGTVFVVAEVPDQGEHDRRTEPEGHRRAEDREGQHTGDGHDGDPRFPWPSLRRVPRGAAGQIVQGRGGAALDGDQQPPGEVQHDPDPAAEREQHGADPYQNGIDTPVLGHAAAQAGQLRVGRAAANRPDRTHPTILPSRAGPAIRDDPQESPLLASEASGCCARRGTAGVISGLPRW